MMACMFVACGGTEPLPTALLPETTLQADVRLSAIGRFEIRNQGSQSWSKVTFTVNDDYRYTTDSIGSGGFEVIPALEFATKDGKRFNPYELKPMTFVITATVDSHGTAGRWAGNFK